MITGNVIGTLLFIILCTFQYGCVDSKIRISANSNFQIAADDKNHKFSSVFL